MNKVYIADYKRNNRKRGALSAFYMCLEPLNVAVIELLSLFVRHS